MLFPVHSKTSAILLNIRNQRLLKNYSEEYMAAKMEISAHGYSQIEDGEVNITLQMLILIAEILEIELTNLITG